MTTRDVDAAWLFLAKVHCSGGGRMSIEPHGRGGYHYPRLILPGRTGDGKQRRFYIQRAIAGTPPGYLTIEPANFHNQSRGSLGGTRRQPEGSGYAKIGRPEAIQRGDRLPAGLTEDRVAELLEDGYRLLDEVPFGKAA